MENFLELVKLRQSDRAYDMEKPVEREDLDYILEAAHLAPSACNAQPWSFIVVTDPEIRLNTAKAIADKTLGMNQFVYQAPVIIVIIEESANFTSTIGGKVKQKHFPHIDLGLMTAHLTLAAAEKGLGTCILGWFNEKQLRKILHIPTSKRPMLVVTLGHSTQAIREKRRKSIKDCVHFNKY